MDHENRWKKKKVTIVGGGAAGLAAAISAARIIGGEQVRIIEKNDKVGRKLLATGNGRCNYTNARCTYRDLTMNEDKYNSFTKEALSHFTIQETLGFFEGLGIIPREETEGRIYPYSEQAAAVQEALKTEAEALGIEIIDNNCVKGIEIQSGTTVRNAENLNEETSFAIALDKGETVVSQKVILATGGKAGIQYGSSGDGYPLAVSLGHTICKPIPALVPLLSEDPLLKPLKGIRAKGRVTLRQKDCLIDSEYGEIQFTGEGLSGICIFNLSRQIRLKEEADRYQDFTVGIDLLPEFDQETLYRNLKKRQERFKNRRKIDFFNGMVQQKLAEAIFRKSTVTINGHAGDWTDTDLHRLSEALRNWEIVLSGTKGWKEAQVTSGGVITPEIQPHTMESKLTAGLYFAGEIMDVDGKCGGYNLQWAWTSGILAGRAAAESCRIKRKQNVKNS